MSEEAPLFPRLDRDPEAVGWMRRVDAAPRKVSFAQRGGPSVAPAPVRSAPPPRASAPPAGSAAQLLAQVEAEIRAEVDRELDAAKQALAAEQEKLVEAQEQARAEREALTLEKQRFSAAIAALGDVVPQAREQLEEPALAIAVGIAEALIEREVEKDPTLHSALARAALAGLGGGESVQLRVSSRTYDAVVETEGGPTLSHGGGVMELVVDGSLDGLGAVAVSDWTRVDARLSERLAAALDAMTHERRREGDD